MIYSTYMIGYLSGKVIYSKEKYIIIDVQGVGYKVFVSSSVTQSITENDTISLWIYTAVREDTLDLFGFLHELDQEIFELLLNVSGIGPKSALGILSVADIGSLAHAIKNENVSYLTQVSGIGKKTAEKIVIELKDKMEKLTLEYESDEPDHVRDVIDALLAMGYHERSIREALRSLDESITNTSEMIRESLKMLGK
jgi:holliday junction DNA helicase RuvA